MADDLALRTTFEEATDLSDLAAEADGAVAAAESLRDAEEADAEGAGPLGAVGLLFSGAEDDLAEAQEAFDAGDYPAVEAAAADVESTIDGAALVGTLRLLGLLVLVLFGAGAWRLLRRGKTRRTAAALEADGAEGVGSSTDGSGQVGM